MANGEAELAAAREWCLKARQLLGIFNGRRHGDRMDKALAQIGSDLKLAKQEMGKLPEGRKRTDSLAAYDRFTEQFVQISKLAKKAAESGVNEMAQITSERLVVLQFEIKKAFYASSKETDDALQAAKDLMAEHAVKYQGRYETMLANAEKQRKELLALNRPKQTDAYEAPVAAAIARARDFAADKSFSEAIGELTAAEESHKTQLKKVEADRAASKAQARDKPVYDAQHRAVAARLAKIAALPGTREAHTRLAGAVELIAQAAGGAMPYRKAFEQLAAFEGPLAVAEQAGTQSEQQADQTLGGLVGRAQQALKDFGALAGLAQPDAVNRHSAVIAAAVKKLDGDQPDAAGARRDLETIVSAIADTSRLAAAAKTRCDQDMPGVRTTLDELQARAKTEVYQPLLARLRQASAEVAAQQFERAVQTLAELKIAADDAHGIVTPAWQQWQQALADVAGNEGKVLEQAANLPLAELKGAGTLLARFIAARDYVAAIQHDWAAAGLVAAEVKTKVGADDNSGWRKVLKDHAALQPLRGEATQAVERVRVRLQALAQAGGDTAAFESRLNRLSIDWHTTSSKTVDRGVIDPALQALKQGMDTLFGEIDAILKDNNQLALSKASAETAKAAATFQAKKADAQKLIRHLGQEYPAETADFTLRLTAAEADLAGKPQQALQAATQLALDVQARIDEKGRAVDQLRAQALQVGNRYLKAAQQLKGQNSEIGKAYDPLLHQIQALLGAADSTLLAVVQDAKNQLDAFQAIYDQRAQELAKIPAKLAELKTKLDDKALKARAPRKHALLDARLKQEIPGRCAEDSAGALQSVLVPFEAEIDSAIIAAGAGAQSLQRITELAGRLDIEAAKLDGAPALHKDLKARIQAARKPAEGAELATEAELNRLQLMIESALADPELSASLEQGVQQRAFEAERQRDDWEAQFELFELQELKAASAQHSRIAAMFNLSSRNEQLWGEMQTAYGDAKTLGEAKDFGRAFDRLAQARRMARQYADNPDGAAVTAKKNLAKVAEVWRSAAAGFVREMNALIDSVRAKVEQDPAYQANADGIVAPLRQLAIAFDGGAFDAALRKINDATELAARRAAKEEGLRALRRVQEVLSADPVLPMLADSPFAKVSTKALKDAARDLEVNLKRA